MRRIDQTLLDSLDIESAIQDEMEAERNLMPPEPWISALSTNVGPVTTWVRTRLQAGAMNTPASYISAKKALQGTRPVAILGMGERIAYRALSEYTLGQVEQLAREAGQYTQFLQGPISFAFDGVSGLRRLGSAKVSHVVETDITAFYQYVDHDILRDELYLQTANIEGADLIHEFLSELQASAYGLPQLFGPSDWLSEIYIRILERELVRQGFNVWRYNDDFRIAALSYDEAQDVVEACSSAARGLGLVLNEQKTRILRFVTYMFKNINASIVDAADEFDPNAPDFSVSEYKSDGDATLDEAVKTVASLDLDRDDENLIDLRNLMADNIKNLRKAIKTFTRNSSPGGEAFVARLYIYAPSLTPELSQYLIALGSTNLSGAKSIWDEVALRHPKALSEWQAAWLVYVARVLGLLTSEARIKYVETQSSRGKGGYLRAECFLALAYVSGVEFSAVDKALRVEPEAFLAWYALAMRELGRAGAVKAEQIDAVKNSNRLVKILMES